MKNIVVNGGKPVVLGVSGTVSVPLTMTVVTGTHGAGASLYHGTYPVDTDVVVNGPRQGCGNHSGTYTCKLTFKFTARKTVKKNSQAGAWGVYASAVGNANAQVVNDKAFQVVRAAKLTANATPEPVKKGQTLTVTGRLTRADWQTGAYTGHARQTVKLQFRKKSSSTYTTVKTVTSGTGGALKATARAEADGYWRWSFPGTSTTGAANATGDYVDVR
ncbi:calcium-binding protein [Streptomyces sp. NPDC017179]|uniref:calcium-binding protein n=1 Tax=Streptomyces sp. NPDC017179 TaxID=3364979 RepID=UPI0037B82F75